jgi:hypothetical protein
VLHRSSALMALVLSGCYVTPGEETCTSNPLPEPVETECDDADDLDNDDITDCDDSDIDGDGLRNLWDCSPLDPPSMTPTPAGAAKIRTIGMTGISSCPWARPWSGTPQTPCSVLMRTAATTR